MKNHLLLNILFFIFLVHWSSAFLVAPVTSLTKYYRRPAIRLDSTVQQVPTQPLNNSLENVRVESAQCYGQVTSDLHTPFINCVEITAGMEVDRSLPPIVLLHGMFGSSRNLLGLAKSLPLALEQPRKVFVIDLRNHGKSDWRESMSYDDLVSDICISMRKEKMDSAIFVGHSIGGKIACSLALSHPELVDGLIVLDIAPVTYTLESDEQWRDVVTSLHSLNALPLATINSRAQADRMLTAAIPDDSKRAFCLTQLQPDPITRRLKWNLNIRALAENVENLASFDVPQMKGFSAYDASCSSFDLETLFIAGGKSRFLRSSHLQTISLLFPKFSLVTVREAGHWLHVEAPERIVELIKSYVERER